MSIAQHQAVPEADSIAAEYDAIMTAAGVRIAPEREIVRVVGDDRATFLHGLTSGDIKGARAGDVVPALVLTEHAHVIADLFLWICDGEILIDGDREAWRAARAHLEKLLVADDVEFEDSGLSLIDIEGPRAREAASAIVPAAGALAPWKHVTENSISAAMIPRFGTEAVSILVPRSECEEIARRVAASTAGARFVSESALEIVRIENGIARVGVDTGEKTIALEARLDRSISIGKGCYVGQETIERATARGSLKKRMLALKFLTHDGVRPGMALTLEGREVGHVTSIAISPRHGVVGLATLHHSAWQAGTRLKAGARAEAEVREIGGLS